MKSIAMAALAAAALASWSAAVAQPVPPPPAPPPGPPPPPARGPASDLALEAVQTAVATCTANGYKVTAVVLDSASGPRALLSADGAPDVTAQIAIRKAHTALTFKQPSGQVGDQAKADAALADRIKADPTLITWAGGEPLMAGDEVIGALGVSGAPGGDKDDACATAAVAKIKDRLQ